MPSKDNDNLQHLIDFLRVPTPKAWLDEAIQNIPLLLLDHAHCERKAAASAIHFISKYPEKSDLVAVMSPLAREELLHFEKVCALMASRNILYGPLAPATYAQKMHHFATKGGCTQRLCDQLIVGAIIEARSSERFGALIPVLPDAELGKFYATLVKSETRHFQDYLRLAKTYGKDIDARVDFFLDIENEAIRATEEVFRFHSGIPLSAF
ncbi:MAG: tRNA-(ms[2]io[6]A)-hydroxylase [Tatlockia sp.]|jgi:tRNA-(ms[2]io[6]A)-hydroxylase